MTNILSTSELDTRLVSMANGEVRLDVIPFIAVHHVVDKDLALKKTIAELSQKAATVVFTSANAVKAIANIIVDAQPEWTVYCIGNATKNEVHHVFTRPMIKGSASDSASLAQIIAVDGPREVVFFCGDKRLETLPDILRNNDILVQECVVYETTETPVRVENYYDGILFLSPSAVHSFFSVNTPGKETIMFAIGGTTAAAIKSNTSNKIEVCSQPSKELLVTDAIQYFNKQATA